MPARKYKKTTGDCKQCGKHCECLSWSGLCPECGARRLEQSIRDMRAHEGDYYTKWQERCADDRRSKKATYGDDRI